MSNEIGHDSGLLVLCHFTGEDILAAVLLFMFAFRNKVQKKKKKRNKASNRLVAVPGPDQNKLWLPVFECVGLGVAIAVSSMRLRSEMIYLRVQ